MFNLFVFLTLVRSVSGATLPSCAVVCSSMRVATENSCNIYYVLNGICKAGVLDNQLTYSKPEGSSNTLVPVRVLSSTEVVAATGDKVKPGNLLVFYMHLWLNIFFAIRLMRGS